MVSSQLYNLEDFQHVATDLPIPATGGEKSFMDAPELFPLGMSGYIPEKCEVSRKKDGGRLAFVISASAKTSIAPYLSDACGSSIHPLWSNEDQIIYFLNNYPHILDGNDVFLPFTVPFLYTPGDKNSVGHKELLARVYGTGREIGLRVYSLLHPFVWPAGIKIVLPHPL